jgi:hypothetical protein
MWRRAPFARADSKSACKFRPPREHACARADAIMHYFARESWPGDFAGDIIRMYLALLTDWQDRGDETIPEYGSRHAFGDGIDPPKAQTDR